MGELDAPFGVDPVDVGPADGVDGDVVERVPTPFEWEIDPDCPPGLIYAGHFRHHPPSSLPLAPRDPTESVFFREMLEAPGVREHGSFFSWDNDDGGVERVSDPLL